MKSKKKKKLDEKIQFISLYTVDWQCWEYKVSVHVYFLYWRVKTNNKQNYYFRILIPQSLRRFSLCLLQAPRPPCCWLHHSFLLLLRDFIKTRLKCRIFITGMAVFSADLSALWGAAAARSPDSDGSWRSCFGLNAAAKACGWFDSWS